MNRDSMLSDGLDRRHPDYDRAMLEYVRLCSESERPPDPRTYVMNWRHLGPALLCDIVPLHYRWTSEYGKEGLPVEAILARYQELADDRNAILELIWIEAKFAPCKPDWPGYQERFPKLADAIIKKHEMEEDVDRLSSKQANVGPKAKTIDHPPLPGQNPLLHEGEEIEFQEIVRVDKFLGNGGLKIVHEGFQLKSHRSIAVMAPLESWRRDTVIKEAKLQAQLDHPAIPAVILINDTVDCPARFVEKLIVGENWHSLLNKQEEEAKKADEAARSGLRAAALKKNLKILARACDALDYTHDVWKIIHLDFKPQNVMVGNFNDFYVIDWGSAIHVADRVNPAITAPHKTQVDRLITTCDRTPPEVALGKIQEIDTTTDVFLLGAALYQILAGKAPYGEYIAIEARERALQARIDPPAMRSPDRPIPEELAAIAMKAMSFNQTDRYPDAGSFIKALNAYDKHAEADRLSLRAASKYQQVQQDWNGEVWKNRTGIGSIAPLITPLIEAADEYHQAAAVWNDAVNTPLQAEKADSAEDESPAPDDGEPQSSQNGTASEKPSTFQEEGLKRMIDGEAKVRWLLVDITKKHGEYALAEAQLDLIGALSGQDPKKVAVSRKEVRKAAEQREKNKARFRAAIAGLVGMIVAVILTGLYASEARKQNDAAQKEKRLAENRSKASPLIGQAATAQFEGFGQGSAVFLANALALSPDPTLQSRLTYEIQNALTPIGTSSRQFPSGALAYSSDGHRLVSAHADSGNLHVWDRETGEQLFMLEGHESPDRQVAGTYSVVPRLVARPGNASEVISIGTDGTIRRWDIVKGIEIAKSGKPVAKDATTFVTMDIDPSAKGVDATIVTGNSAGVLQWWQLGGLRQVASVQAHTPYVSAVRVRPDGQGCASAGPDGVVRLWDRSGNDLGRLETSPNASKASPVLSLAFSPDSSELAVARESGFVEIWDSKTKKRIHAIQAHRLATSGRTWAIGVDYLAPSTVLSTGADAAIREWNTRDGTLVAERGRHLTNVNNYQGINTLAVRPGRNEFATGGSDGLTRVWGEKPGQILFQSEGMRTSPLAIFNCTAAAFHPGTNRMITAGMSRDAYLRAWDTTTLRQQRIYSYDKILKPEDRVLSPSTLAIDPAGKRFVSGEQNGDLLFWDIASGKILNRIVSAHTLPTHPALASSQYNMAVASLSWSRDGRRVLSSGFDHRIRIWEAQTGKRLADWSDADAETPSRPGVPAEVEMPSSGLAFSPDEKFVVSSGRDRIIRIWDVETGKIAHRLFGHSKNVVTLVFDPAGKLLASGAMDGAVIVWDWKNRVPLRTWILEPLMGPGAFGSSNPADNVEFSNAFAIMAKTVTSLNFSPNSRLLAASQMDLSISIMDVASGSIPHRSIGHERSRGALPMNTAGVQFAADNVLVSAGSDGTVRRWNLAPNTAGVVDLKALTSIGQVRDARAFAVAAEGDEWVSLDAADMVREATRWNSRTNTPIGSWSETPDQLQGDRPSAVAYAPGRDFLLVGTNKGRRFVIDRKTNKPVKSFPAFREIKDKELTIELRISQWLTAIAVSPDGRTAATNWVDGQVDLWNVADGKLIRTIKHGDARATHLAFRPSGPPHLAIVDINGSAAIYNHQTGTKLTENLKGPRTPELTAGIQYSPDGLRLVQAGSSSEIVFRNVDTGKVSQRLFGHFPITNDDSGVDLISIAGLAFSPDGRRMATCGSDGTVHLWNTEDPSPYSLIAVRTTTTLSTYETEASHTAKIQTDFVKKTNDLLAPSPEELAALGFGNPGPPPTDAPQPANPGPPPAVATDLGAGGGQVPTDFNELIKELGKSGVLPPDAPDPKQFADLLAKMTGNNPIPTIMNTDGLLCVAFLADGKHLIVGGWQPPIRVYDLAAFEMISLPTAELKAQTERMTGLRLLNGVLTPIPVNRLVPIP